VFQVTRVNAAPREIKVHLQPTPDWAVPPKRPAGRFDAFGCGSLSRVSSITLTGPQGPGVKAATVN
jgi:hypothetical protein